MDCQLIRADLVAYQFGSVDLEARDRIDAHLVACPECLKGYLALKREIETAEGGPRPSPQARARLRGAVARELAERRARTAAEPAWWRRPLAFGFAAAACAAAMIAVVAVQGELQQLGTLASPPAAVQK
jgi:anti-sigma factor RsiW